MRIFSDQAIVLDVLDLSERDRIVDFITAEHGRRRAVAIAARSRRSRFAGQLQPLATVHLRWVEKEGRDLGRLNEVELVRPAAAMQTELEGLLLSAYLAEQVRTFVQEGEPAPAFFRLLDATVGGLLAGVDARLATRYFEVWVLRLSGLLPVPRACPLCDRPFEGMAAFEEGDAALICGECARGQRCRDVSAGALAFLARSGREDLAAMAARAWPAAILQEIETLCRAIRRVFLQVDLRSDRTLREIMATLEGQREPSRG